MTAAALLLSVPVGAQQFTVKTNVITLAALSPELGAELITGEHTSVSLSLLGAWHPYRQDIELFVVRPEFRYWFNGRPITREYIGIAAFGAGYDMDLNAHIYRGNALALGLTGGYVFSLNRRISLELGAGTGLLFFRQKQYLREDRYEQSFTGDRSAVNAYGYRIFPIKLELCLSYILF